MHDGVKILTEDLEFHYHGRSLFSRVNLALPENSIIAITGPSGAGKSTLLSIFNRLWQEAGGGHCLGTVRIRFDGRMVDIYRDGMNVARLRQRVGMVFQSPNPLPMSIYKNVAFPLLLAGFAENEQVRERVEKMLQLVQLFAEVKDRLNADGRQLSGGQQQRLCLARALMLEPEVLLLDEPTSSLDPTSCETIENLLLELKKTCTLLVVSHYREQVHRVADQIYDLSAGQLRQVR